jgi:hypothetical protein
MTKSEFKIALTMILKFLLLFFLVILKTNSTQVQLNNPVKNKKKFLCGQDLK